MTGRRDVRLSSVADLDLVTAGSRWRRSLQRRGEHACCKNAQTGKRQIADARPGALVTTSSRPIFLDTAQYRTEQTGSYPTCGVVPRLAIFWVTVRTDSGSTWA